jgi:hypothetical protein
MTPWQWITAHTPSLPVRITAGVLILLTLALLDYRRNRHRATRWREYLFLLICTCAAMAYGALNDQITSAISWEYFYYGKDLDKALGPNIPPEPIKLHLHAALVGVQATWTAGLIIGVALLFANNPRKTRPQLPQKTLLKFLPLIMLITATTAALGAYLGHTGHLTRFNDDFPEMLRTNLWRPRRFMTVFGIHLGGYLGGLLALLTTIPLILLKRRNLSRAAHGFPVSPPHF